MTDPTEPQSAASTLLQKVKDVKGAVKDKPAATNPFE
jgi:hypothetical protein